MTVSLLMKKQSIAARIALKAVPWMRTRCFWLTRPREIPRIRLMPIDTIPIGDILVLRDGLRNITEDADKLLANRKQARLLMRLLDELLERREKEGNQ